MLGNRSPQKPSFTTLVVESNILVQRGILEVLRDVVAPEGIALASSPEEACAAASTYQVDLVLCDVILGEELRLDLPSRLKRLRPRMRIIVITDYQEPYHLLQLLIDGVDGYLRTASLTIESLTTAVVGVTLQRVMVIDGSLRRTVGPYLQQRLQPTVPASGVPLSTRELQVLRSFAQGCTVKEVAYALGVSPRTVERHLETIRAKLGARSSFTLGAIAAHLGLA